MLCDSFADTRKEPIFFWIVLFFLSIVCLLNYISTAWSWHKIYDAASTVKSKLFGWKNKGYCPQPPLSVIFREEEKHSLAMFPNLSLKHIDIFYTKFLLTGAKCLTNSVGWDQKWQIYEVCIKSVLIWHILYLLLLDQNQLTDVTLKSFAQSLQRVLPAV